MEFTAIDVETANLALNSICQIGVVRFRDGKVVEQWKTYVNPDDYFYPNNVAIHCIDDSLVLDAPSFTDVAEQLTGFLSASVVCHHTHYDRSAIDAAYAKHGLDAPEVNWLDTSKVVRRTWPDRAKKGYGLKQVSEMLGIKFQHHDALEDARAAGEILIHAIQKSGLSVNDWVTRSRQPITPRTYQSRPTVRHAQQGNAEGPLCGEIAVFTGALTMPRREAAAMAAEAGCEVKDSVNKSTTLLIVGDQDIAKLAGHEKSSKQRRAEALISNGQAIRVLGESDFILLLESARKIASVV